MLEHCFAKGLLDGLTALFSWLFIVMIILLPLVSKYLSVKYKIFTGIIKIAGLVYAYYVGLGYPEMMVSLPLYAFLLFFSYLELDYAKDVEEKNTSPQEA